MKRSFTATKRLVIFTLALGLAACKPIYQNHGYVPTDVELSLVEVGADTRDTVAATIGRPSAAGLLDESGWFYVKSRYSTFGPLARKEEDRQVVAISFDDKGIVTNVERFGLEDGKIIPLSRRVTTSNVKGQSFLRQLFGNIGATPGLLPKQE